MRRRKNKSPQRSFPDSSQESLEMAISFHQLGEYSAAERSYLHVLKDHPEHAQARHLLGRLYFAMGRAEQAIDSLERAHAVAPDSADILLDLANMLHENGNLQQALGHLQKLLDRHPARADAHNTLGIVLKDLDRTEESLAAYQRALELEPDHLEARRNQGRLLARLDRTDEAIESLQAARHLAPQSTECLATLASLLRRAGRGDEATEVLEAWTTLAPDDPVPRHLLAAHRSGNVPERASDEYVRAVFDRFASSFDSDLERLQYQGPQIIQQAMAERFVTSSRQAPSSNTNSGTDPNTNPDTSLNTILDAGCGTGLCGPILRPYAKTLIGVDLSRGMLDGASETGCYDRLVEAELTEYLRQTRDELDLIVSLDTLGYFGDLRELISAAHNALRAGGTLLATFELDQSETPTGYTLMLSGRYRHTPTYLQSCLREAGFHRFGWSEVILRTEAGEPVAGGLFSAERAEAVALPGEVEENRSQ